MITWMSIKKALLLFFVATCSSQTNPAAVNHPVKIFHSSQPVLPDQTVLATGGPWNAAQDLRVFVGFLINSNPLAPVLSDPISNVTEVPIVSKSNYSISFIVPAKFPRAIYAYYLADVKGPVSTWYYVNLPVLWFAQGDEMTNATKGGWVGVYGTSLLVSNDVSEFKPSLRITNATGSYFLPPSTKKPYSNRWAYYFDVPASISEGSYRFSYHSGYGGPIAWTSLTADQMMYNQGIINIAPARRNVWPNTVFNLSSLPGHDWDDKLTNALTLANKNGGGNIFFPPGVYNLTKEINLRDNNRILFKGSGKGVTILRWVNSSQSYSCIVGGTFSVEDLTVDLQLDKYLSPALAAKNLTCQGFNVFQSIYDGTNEYMWFKNIHVTGSMPSCLSNTYNSIFSFNNTQYVSIDNVVVEDSWTSVSVGGNSNYTRITNSILHFRLQHLKIRCGRNHVVENITRITTGDTAKWNLVGGDQGGLLIGEYCSTSVTRDIYYGHTTSISKRPIYLDNTVADGKEGFYYGKIKSVNSATVTLARALFRNNFPNSTSSIQPSKDLNENEMLGAIVTIVGGIGTGQYRFLTGIKYENQFPMITIDRPWDLNPDITSYIAISKMKGRMLIVNNNFTSEGIHMLGWMTALDLIYAENHMGNRFDNTEGWQGRITPPDTPCLLYSLGGFVYNNITEQMPGFHSGSWYHMFLDNIANTGNTTGLAIQFKTRLPSKEILSSSWSETISFGNVIRGTRNIGDQPLTLLFDAYNGPFIAESNQNVTSITFDGSKGSNYGVIRLNTPSKRRQISVYCDGNKIACNSTASCSICLKTTTLTL